jgi:hypothetical protein
MHYDDGSRYKKLVFFYQFFFFTILFFFFFCILFFLPFTCGRLQNRTMVKFLWKKGTYQNTYDMN